MVPKLHQGLQPAVEKDLLNHDARPTNSYMSLASTLEAGVPQEAGYGELSSMLLVMRRYEFQHGLHLISVKMLNSSGHV